MSLRSKFKYSLNTFNFSGAVKQSGQIPNLIKLNRNINRLFLHNKRFVKRGLYKRSGFVNIYKKLSSSNVIHKFTFDRYTALPFQKVQTKWTKWAAMFMNLYIRRRSVRIGIRRFEPLSRYQLRYLGNFCATAVGLQYHNSFWENNYKLLKEDLSFRRKLAEKAVNTKELFLSFAYLYHYRIRRRKRLTRRPFKRKRHKFIRMLRFFIQPKYRGGRQRGFIRYRFRYRRNLLLKYYFSSLLGFASINKYKNFVTYIKRPHIRYRSKVALHKWALRIKWQLINLAFASKPVQAELMCQNGLIYHNGKQVADFNESVNVGSVLQLSLGFHSVVKSSVFKKWYRNLFKKKRIYRRKSKRWWPMIRRSAKLAVSSRLFFRYWRGIQSRLQGLNQGPRYYIIDKSLLTAVLWRPLRSREHVLEGMKFSTKRKYFYGALQDRFMKLCHVRKYLGNKLERSKNKGNAFYKRWKSRRFRFKRRFQRREMFMFDPRHFGWAIKSWF